MEFLFFVKTFIILETIFTYIQHTQKVSIDWLRDITCKLHILHNLGFCVIQAVSIWKRTPFLNLPFKT